MLTCLKNKLPTNQKYKEDSQNQKEENTNNTKGNHQITKAKKKKKKKNIKKKKQKKKKKKKKGTKEKHKINGKLRFKRSINIYLLIIILNVKGLNAPIQRLE